MNTVKNDYLVGCLISLSILLYGCPDDGDGGGSGSSAPPPQNTQYLSGYVRTSSGAGVSGVSVQVTRPNISHGSTTTNSSGYWYMSGFHGPYSSAYTVTPSRSGYTFSPPSRSVDTTSNGCPSRTDIDFTIVTNSIKVTSPNGGE